MQILVLCTSCLLLCVLFCGEQHIMGSQFACSRQTWKCTGQYMQVISKPFSSVSNEEGYEMSGVELRHATLNTQMFSPLPLASEKMLSHDLISTTGLSRFEDVLKHLGADLAMRCWKTHPSDAAKNASRRELISPVIFAAAVLAGKVGVLKQLLLPLIWLGIQSRGWQRYILPTSLQ